MNIDFCKLLYHRKCKRRGVGGQKKTNLINGKWKCPCQFWSFDVSIVCQKHQTNKYFITINVAKYLLREWPDQKVILGSYYKGLLKHLYLLIVCLILDSSSLVPKQCQIKCTNKVISTHCYTCQIFWFNT